MEGVRIIHGVTKRIYDADIRDIQSMWTKELKSIKDLLPQRYTDNDIVGILKEFYPHEWKAVTYKKQYYDIKDRELRKKNKKMRYKMPSPEVLFRWNPTYKYLLKPEMQMNHAKFYDENKAENLRRELEKKRIPNIQRINDKISLAKSHTQQVTPEYLEKLIGLYSRKNITQKDKMYILEELKKYYNDKIIRFFFKINDTELNFQLRELAHHYLQNYNYQPRLRKQKYMIVLTGNKKRKQYLKKEYAKETYNIPFNPDELMYRINNGKEQKIQSYDFFISHSSKDSTMIQKLVCYENSKGKVIFCDWINDADYLKRKLLREATLKVLKLRLEQSEALLFVDSPYSRESVWCKYELNYCRELNKPMFIMTIDEIISETYKVSKLDDDWYIDSQYKESIIF